jgi:hypothetical protein
VLRAGAGITAHTSIPPFPIIATYTSTSLASMLVISNKDRYTAPSLNIPQPNKPRVVEGEHVPNSLGSIRAHNRISGLQKALPEHTQRRQNV